MYTVRPIKVEGRFGKRWFFSPLAAGLAGLLAYFGPGVLKWQVRGEGNPLLAAFVAPLVLAGLHAWILRRSIRRPLFYLLYLLPLWPVGALTMIVIAAAIQSCARRVPEGTCWGEMGLSLHSSEVPAALAVLALFHIVLALLCELRGYLLSLSLHRPDAHMRRRIGNNLSSEWLALAAVVLIIGAGGGGYTVASMAWLAYWLISGGATGREVEAWVAREERRGERRLRVMRAKSMRGFSVAPAGAEDMAAHVVEPGLASDLPA